MIPAQPVQVTCPQCSQPFTALIYSIIDVGRQPELKELLLRGRLNLARCPRCGAAGTIGTPLLYHDADKELALILIPTELNLPRNEQEQLIGTLTNTLMESLPPEKRKGYLLRPKTFLSLEGLVRAVLEADGITQEMLEAQEKRVRLIQELQSLLDDEERFQELVEEHRDELDYELFLILRALIDTAHEEGRADEAQALDTLRSRLLEATGESGAPTPEQVEVRTFDDLLDVLLSAESREALQTMVAVNRPIFDYSFFLQLAEHVEAAEQAGNTERAGALRQLRQDVLEATEAVDQATETALQNAAQRLRDILQADDPHTAAQERLDEIDEAFLIVLAANIAQAEEQGNQEVAGTLRNLYEFILDRLEEQMPPQARLINRLLRAEAADERARMLEEAGEAVDGDLVQVLEALLEDAQMQGQSQLSHRLREIIELVRSQVGTAA